MRLKENIIKLFSINKWKFYWLVFIILVCMFIFLAIFFEDKKWIGNALQTLGSISGVYATVLVFLHSKQSSDKQFREQLDYLQMLNAQQIEALHYSTEKQINKLQELTEKQITALSENTAKQIQTYSGETKKIINELIDNSILLGEILKRELEKAILQTDQQIKDAETRLQAIKGFVLGRTDVEKARQLNEHNSFLEWLRNWRIRLYNKYQLLLNDYKD